MWRHLLNLLSVYSQSLNLLTGINAYTWDCSWWGRAVNLVWLRMHYEFMSVGKCWAARQWPRVCLAATPAASETSWARRREEPEENCSKSGKAQELRSEWVVCFEQCDLTGLSEESPRGALQRQHFCQSSSVHRQPPTRAATQPWNWFVFEQSNLHKKLMLMHFVVSWWSSMKVVFADIAPHWSIVSILWQSGLYGDKAVRFCLWKVHVVSDWVGDAGTEEDKAEHLRLILNKNFSSVLSVRRT